MNYERIAAMIESLSASHYARDVKGRQADYEWRELAQTLRTLAAAGLFELPRPKADA